MTITLHGVNICQRALRCSSCPQSQNAGFALNRYCVSPLIESPLVSESPTLLRTPLPADHEGVVFRALSQDLPAFRLFLYGS